MAAMAAKAAKRRAGELLRGWRESRRLSQLELAGRVGVSSRHISFVENGRSKPSRDMVLRLAEHLDVPLRDRNQLLLAAGFAPTFTEASLESPAMLSIRAALRRLLSAHAPYPALAVDRLWNIVEANDGLKLLTEGVSPALLSAPVNALRLTLHPDGMAPRLVNLGEVRANVFSRLRRSVVSTADPGLRELYDELRAYPCDQPEPPVELPGPGEVIVPMRLRHPAGELAFLNTVATFGTPLDITVSELVIESFFPADDATAALLRAL